MEPRVRAYYSQFVDFDKTEKTPATNEELIFCDQHRGPQEQWANVQTFQQLSGLFSEPYESAEIAWLPDVSSKSKSKKRKRADAGDDQKETQETLIPTRRQGVFLLQMISKQYHNLGG